MLHFAHWPVKVQGIGEDIPSNMLSFINFEPLELYWTYFLALRTMTPKIPPMRLMSLDHEPKMRCCAMSSNYGPWWDYIAMSFGPWALTSFLWIKTLLGFKIDSPKIHDNIDMVRVANEMKSYGVKNLPSTMCNRALTYIVERSIYLFILSNGKKKKNPLQYLSKAWFFMLWDPFGFGGVTSKIIICCMYGLRLSQWKVLSILATN